MGNPRVRRVLASFTTLALVPGIAALSWASPAAAAPLPAPYAASAHGDLVGVSASLMTPALPPLAGAKVGHSFADVDSTRDSDDSTASSANLDGTLVFNAVPIQVDEQVATAAPKDDPAAATLLDVPLAPIADIGTITADTYADYTDDASCVPAVGGERLVSDSLTTLAGVTLADVPLVGSLATIEASSVRSTTTLVDDGVGGSDVVASNEAVVGDIELLGGQVRIDVGTSDATPVTLRARSDGAVGTSELINPPIITATVAGNATPIPLNGQPVDVPVELPDLSVAEVTITAFDPNTLDDSDGALGAADLQYLLRVQVKVLSLPGPLGVTVADLDLSLAPLQVRAEAPEGGVECVVADTTAPDAPVITSPTDGSSTTDNTPPITGSGAEEGSTATVYDTDGATVLCTDDSVGADGLWSCTPTTPMTPGNHTITATATDEAGNESESSPAVTFTVLAPDPGDTTPPAAPVITSPTEGSSTDDTTPTVTGTAEPGSTVRVTEGGIVICTGVADAAGNWSCTPATPLTQGPHTFGATATDAAGNASPADSVTFTIVAPANPDRDGDGLSDVDETKVGTNPDDPDTDDDELLDGPEVNAMTINQRFEVCGKKATKSIRVTTDPLNKDTDRDGLTDGLEVKGYAIKQFVFVTRSGDKVLIGKTRSNPTKADTDKDGLKDKAEKTGSANKKWRRHKSDPTKCDTDQGGVSDGREVKLGSDPSKIKSGPNDLESRARTARRGSSAVG